MKKQIGMILFGIIILFLLGGVFMLLNRSSVSDAQEQDVHRYFTPGRNMQEVSSISLQNVYSSYTIYFNADGWMIDAAEGLPLDITRLAIIREYVSRLQARLVEADAYDLASYGLDQPEGKLTVRFFDGDRLDLYIGSTVRTGTYVQQVGSRNVYIFRPAQAQPFFWDYRAYISLMVTERMIGIIYDRAVFSGTWRPEPIVLEPNPERLLSGVDYVVVSPRQRVAGRAAGILASISEIRALETAMIFPDDATIALFGLDGEHAFSVVKVEWGDESLTITASAPTSTGHFYVMTCRYPIIWFMHASPRYNEFPQCWYASLYQDFLSTFIFHPVYDSLAEIEIWIDDEVYTFLLSGRGEPVYLATDGRYIEFEDFYILFRLLFTAPNEGFHEGDLHESLLPMISIYYRYVDPNRSDQVLRFYEYAPLRAVGALDAIPEFIIRTSYIRQIIDTVREIAIISYLGFI